MMTEIEYNFSLIMPDQAEWLASNKKNLAARKEEWKLIQPSLKKFINMNQLPSGSLSVHKSLFFKGEIPDDYMDELARKDKSKESPSFIAGGNKFHGSYLFFYVWYHPCLTVERVRELFEQIDHPPFVSGGIAKYAPHYLTHENGLRMFSRFKQYSDYYYDYGMLGGKEELVAPWVILGDEHGERNETAWQHYRIQTFSSSMTTRVMTHFLDGTTCLGARQIVPELSNEYIYPHHNPRGYCQYIWPQLSKFILRECPNFIQEVIADKFFDQILQAILFFDDHPGTAKDDPLAIACHERIMNQYRNNELADWLAQAMRDAEKQGLQLIEE